MSYCNYEDVQYNTIQYSMVEEDKEDKENQGFISNAPLNVKYTDCNTIE